MTRQEILERIVQIVYDCVPELAGIELKEDTAVSADLGMDSMNFILVICKLEEAFGVRIPNRRWNTLSTLGQVVDAIEQYGK